MTRPDAGAGQPENMGLKTITGPQVFKHDHSVDLVLARVSQYAWDYGREL